MLTTEERAPAPGQRLGLSSWWAGSRKRDDATWTEATHFSIHLLVLNPETLGRPLASLGIALQLGMCGDAFFFDCCQYKRHWLPGLCLRALLTALLTSYF